MLYYNQAQYLKVHLLEHFWSFQLHLIGFISSYNPPFIQDNLSLFFPSPNYYFLKLNKIVTLGLCYV